MPGVHGYDRLHDTPYLQGIHDTDLPHHAAWPSTHPFFPLDSHHPRIFLFKDKLNTALYNSLIHMYYIFLQIILSLPIALHSLVN